MKPPLNNAFHGQVDDQKFDFSINRIIVMSYTIWWLPQKKLDTPSTHTYKGFFPIMTVKHWQWEYPQSNLFSGKYDSEKPAAIIVQGKV